MTWKTGRLPSRKTHRCQRQQLRGGQFPPLLSLEGWSARGYALLHNQSKTTPQVQERHWLRPALIFASQVLPSIPPLSHNVKRHFFDAQFGGFAVSGIHRCPHTLQTATLRIRTLPQKVYPANQPNLEFWVNGFIRLRLSRRSPF